MTPDREEQKDLPDEVRENNMTDAQEAALQYINDNWDVDNWEVSKNPEYKPLVVGWSVDGDCFYILANGNWNWAGE